MPTWNPIANVTLGSAASTVTFSSISQAYRDLIVVVNAKNTTGNTGLRMQLNLDTGSNYSYVVVEGDGSSAVVGSATRTDMVGGPNATTDSQQIYHIVDYSLTDRHKTILVRADFPSTYVDMLAERWANTAAVASVKLFPAANQFAAGSTFALYGVSA